MQMKISLCGGTNSKSYLACVPFAKLCTTKLDYKIKTNQYTIYNSTKWHCIISSWLEIATIALLAFGHGNSTRGRYSLLWYLPWRELSRGEYSIQKKLARIPPDSTRRPQRYHAFSLRLHAFCLLWWSFLWYFLWYLMIWYVPTSSFFVGKVIPSRWNFRIFVEVPRNKAT